VAVSDNVVRVDNTVHANPAAGLVHDALALAGDTPHGLSARVQYCLYGAQTIFASDHGRALPDVSR
jgi:hypothetical protein